MAVSEAWHTLLTIKGVMFWDALSLLARTACRHCLCATAQVIGGDMGFAPP